MGPDFVRGGSSATRGSRRGATAVALALTMLGGAVTALAQARDPAQDEEARRHYDQGQVHFDLAEYDEAIARFRDAYAISRAPLLLFNIGQAHRLRGDCAQAHRFYENYLTHAPDAHNTKLVEDLLEEMQACVAAAGEPPATSPEADGDVSAPGPRAAETSGPMAEVVAPERAPRQGAALRWSGIASAGAGVALVATSGLFAARARSAAGDLTDECLDGCEWEDVADRDEARRSAARSATITAAAGGGLLLGGAVLYLLGRRAQRTAPAVSVAPSSGGGEVSVTWRF